MKSIACINQNMNKFEHNELHFESIQRCYKQREAQIGLLGPLGDNSRLGEL